MTHGQFIEPCLCLSTFSNNCRTVVPFPTFEEDLHQRTLAMMNWAEQHDLTPAKYFFNFHLLLDSKPLQRLHLDNHSLVPFPKHSTAKKLYLCEPLNKTILNIFHQMKNVIVHLKLKPTLQFDENIWRVLPLY